MNALGTQLLLDLKDCSPELLDNLPYIKQSMISAAEEAGATIVGENFHKFEPLGVTGIVAISESHLCIHTWPEHGYAAADIYTCVEGFMPNKATSIIIDYLHSLEPTITEVQRGFIPADSGTLV